MKFSLIICTYQRPFSLLKLLESVRGQSVLPDQILVIDGSLDNETEKILEKKSFPNLEYFKVEEESRGLTRQRNYGIRKVRRDMEVVCFLDDDTLLDPSYFEELIDTYYRSPGALGVSGYISNEGDWRQVTQDYSPSKNEFLYENWVRTEGSRFQLRRKFGLEPGCPPGYMPDFSHGYSTGFLPPSGKTYEVEFFMGCSMSFRRKVFEDVYFSSYFEGYGLYEDMDFCLRVAKKGKLYINTRAKLEHHHEVSGRPNSFSYGKMVIWNGWYVWRIKNSHPSLNAKLKWYSTSFLLAMIRLMNTINSTSRQKALMEGFGRMAALWGILFNRPSNSRNDY